MSTDPIPTAIDPDSKAPAIDTVVRGLVREYLYRSGHRYDLEVFDRHTTRAPPMTTSDLVKALHLVKLYKRNSVRGMSPSDEFYV